MLPLPSYSLKEIEKYIGYKRTQDEYGGNWSMAQYIEATETSDAARRDELMDDIRTYNREDLEATLGCAAVAYEEMSRFRGVGRLRSRLLLGFSVL